MISKLILWVEKWANHHHATKALATVSFVESSFFPVPPFLLMVAMLIHEKRPSWIKIATIGMVSSVLGGVFAYYVGMFFYEYVGAPLVAWYGLTGEIERLGQLFKDNVFTTIIIGSLSPVPYKVFTLSAGLFSVNIVSFILASIVGRSIRFYIVGYLADKYGVHAKRFMLEQQRTTWIIFTGGILIVTLYFLFLK